MTPFRLHRHPPMVRAVTGGQWGAGRRQVGIDDLGKEPVTVVLREEAGRGTGGGEQEGLGGEIRLRAKSVLLH